MIRILLEKGHRVIALVNGDESTLDFAKDHITIHPIDCRDIEATTNLLSRFKFDYFIHLAAQSSIPKSWSNPIETLETNIIGTFSVLDALKKTNFGGRILLVGAGAEYGTMEKHDPSINEERDFRPTSFYGVSKVASDMLGYFYSHSLNMKVVRVRPFNITGPGKIGDACSDFARNIVKIERYESDVLRVGNLKAVRDYLDVEDAVQGFLNVLFQGKVGECYNICSNNGYRIADLLGKMIEFSKAKIKVEEDSSKIRPVDDPVDVGDNRKLRNLGWEPRIPIETTLLNILNYWRSK